MAVMCECSTARNLTTLQACMREECHCEKNAQKYKQYGTLGRALHELTSIRKDITGPEDQRILLLLSLPPTLCFCFVISLPCDHEYIKNRKRVVLFVCGLVFCFNFHYPTLSTKPVPPTPPFLFLQ